MPQKKQHRLVFFDNLRAILIILVVVLHSIGGFGAIPGVRTAAATSGAMLLYYLEMVLEAFLMSALFFVAGYFALPSLVSRSPAAFLAVKLRRLGAPLVVGAFLLVPTGCFLQTLLYSVFTDTPHPGYLTFFAHYVSGALRPQIGLGWTLSDFSHGWLWFLSLLLFFQVIAWAVYYLIRLSLRSRPSTENTAKSTFLLGIPVQAGVIVLTALSFWVIDYYLPGRQFYTIWNVLLVQPDKVVFYAAFYCLGIWGYRGNWFRSGGRSPFPVAFWSPVCTAALIVFLAIVPRYSGSESLTNWFRFSYSCVQSVLCFSLIAVSSAAVFMKWRVSSRFSRFLARNAYAVYIIHFPVVLLFKYPLMTAYSVPPLFGFSLVLAGSLAASYLLSELFVRPHPYIATGALILINGVLVWLA